jgi:hypothetical protein
MLSSEDWANWFMVEVSVCSGMDARKYGNSVIDLAARDSMEAIQFFFSLFNHLLVCQICPLLHTHLEPVVLGI